MPGPPPVRDGFLEANLEIGDFAAKGKDFFLLVQTHDLRDWPLPTSYKSGVQGEGEYPRPRLIKPLVILFLHSWPGLGQLGLAIRPAGVLLPHALV